MYVKKASQTEEQAVYLPFNSYFWWLIFSIVYYPGDMGNHYKKLPFRSTII